MSRTLLFAISMALLLVVQAGIGVVSLHLSQEATSQMFCAAYNEDWVVLPEEETEARPTVFAGDGCDVSEELEEALKDRIVLVERGNCTFLDKIITAQRGGAYAVVIVSNDTDRLVPYISPGNQSWVTVPVLSVSTGDGYAIVNATLAGNAWLAFFDTPFRKFDWSMVALALLATTLVALSAFSHYFLQRSVRPSTSEPESSDVQLTNLYLDVRTVVLLLVGMILMLTLLYALFRYLVYVVIGLFVCGSFASLTWLLSAALRRIPRGPLCTLSWLQATVGTKDAMVLLTSATLVGVWLANRQSDWAWCLQNLLGSSLVLCILGVLRLPSMQVAVVLLLLFFCYDIFMVFVTPLLTPTKESIMVKVATGMTEAGEEMPLVLKMPRLYRPITDWVCNLPQPYSLIGLGDMLIPGLFVSFLLSADLSLRGNTQRTGKARFPSYYAVGLISYLIGLAATTFSMVLMDRAQPALLFLVPCLLVPALLQAWARGELAMLWSGKIFPVDYDLLSASVDGVGAPLTALETIDDDGDV